MLVLLKSPAVGAGVQPIEGPPKKRTIRKIFGGVESSSGNEPDNLGIAVGQPGVAPGGVYVVCLAKRETASSWRDGTILV
jgi:hypothetical protein